MKYLILLLMFPLSLLAGVNLKNGNFYISYTDIVTTSKGVTLDVTRTYNSKSTRVGWYGYGWGTPFEVKLEPSIDGSVIIYENGTGGKSRFVPSTNISKSTVDAAVKKIVTAVKVKNKLSEKSEKDLIKRLDEDNFLRHKMANAYGIKTTLALGTKFTSHHYGMQTLEVVKQGYKRSFDSGLVQYFNKAGDLIGSKDKNGYKLQLQRNKTTGLVEKITDSAGNQIYVEWFADGKLKSLASNGKKKSTFKYNGDDLVASVDINDKSYSYGYDSNHNLTKITDETIKEKNNKNIEISYAPKSFFVTKIKQRSGELVEYIYESDPKNSDLHYWTTVIKEGFNNKKYANQYEYEHKLNPDGSQFLYRTKFTTGADWKNNKIVGGLIKETVNNEFELPTKVTQGDRKVEMEYKNGFLVSKKSNDGSFLKLEYNDKVKKVSKVTNNAGSISYSYNKKGELSQASKSDGSAVLLVYDMNGKITQMVDKQDKQNRTLTFKYNAQGKPVEIEMDKIGKVMVDYDNFGQVKKVDSKGGREVASQVTDAFQNLLTIVRPAGVNLSL